MTAETAGVARITVEKGRAGAIGDSVFRTLTFFFALLVLLILGGVIVSLIAGAWPAFRTYGFGFIVNQVWNPVTEQFGALAPIYGTLVTSAIAMLIGVPVAFGVALFITEICPLWLKRPMATMIELLAAIPSIIYGIWGLFVFAPFVQQYVQPAIIDTLGNIPGIGALFAGPPLGIGVLTAGFILAIMVLPFISSIMRDVFETVPPMLKESAYGLGATRSEVVWQVVVPYTRIGVIGGIMLGLGPGVGRDHGRHIRDRQRPQDQCFDPAAGDDNFGLACQRVYRGVRRPLSLVIDRARFYPVRHHFYRAGDRQDHADAVAKAGGRLS